MTRTRAQAAGRRSSTKKRASGVRIGEESVRARILLGAAKLIAREGVRPVSVEDILGAADVSRRTFYRLYDGKEAVLLALYRVGTDRLLDACRLAVTEEPDPVRQIERCIDAHLGTAREESRLVFVLGGEAQRRESLLHARRVEVHEAITALLASGSQLATGKRIDPFVFRALVVALEGITRLVLEQGDEGRSVAASAFDRARRVMLRVASGALHGAGPTVTEMPTRAAARGPHFP